MYSKYLIDGEIKPEYTKTFISIFDGWLGEENLHKLDEVTPKDWSKFNDLIRKVAQVYKIQRVDSEKEIFVLVNDVEELLSNYEEAMNKDSSEFTRIFIPSLDCIIKITHKITQTPKITQAPIVKFIYFYKKSRLSMTYCHE